MFAVDDGIMNGNFNLADVLFLIAAIIFAIAAILPFTHQAVDGTARVGVRTALIPVGLCLISIAWLVL